MTDRAKAIVWAACVAILSGVVLAVGLLSALPLAILAERGISRPSLAWVAAYWASLPGHPGYWLGLANRLAGEWPSVLAVAAGTPFALLGLGLMLNPFAGGPTIFGSARWARWRDLRAMGLLDGFIIVLGRWRGHWLRLPETLSVLCIAPPGTGKTAAIVVPTILTGDGASMIINDVKPELYRLTAGYRRRLGPVYRFDWAGTDGAGPRWNPLSPTSLPEAGAARDLAIDRLAHILIPDPAGQSDPYWSRKGRTVLAGLIHFILAKCAAGNGENLPPAWHGREPCFPMLLDWLSEAVFAAGEEVERLREADAPGALMADPVRLFLERAVREARAGSYPLRAIQELTQLASTPDRERGSILSTVDGGLGIFKNAGVRRRSMVSDLDFAVLRGYRDPRSGRVEPVTIYLCVRQEDARALGVMTGLFIEALSAYLIGHPPGAEGLGPLPALFVLDEFPQMPKLAQLIDGPAVGRGQKVSYLLIGQDFGQIEEKYGKTGLETLISTTAAKVILPLNNDIAAKRFSEMVGNRTHEGESRSRTHGLSRQANPFAVNINRSYSGVPLIHPADFMAMARGRHVVLYQKFTNRPILAETPFYFEDRQLRRRILPAPE